MTSIVRYLTSRDMPYRTDFSFLAALFGAVYLQFLGYIPLIEPDEGRYAEIPREMLERGDFVTPFLNYVKYFEKPPLIYWLNAASMKMFGENEFAARLPSALCGVLTVLLVYHLGRRLFDRRAGFLGAVILGSSLGFMVQSRLILTDMVLTFCLSTALGFFILAARDDEERKGFHYHLFYLFAALSVLAKGLIGILLPGMVIFFFLLLSRRWRLLREMRPVTGLLLFLAVAAPWFVVVSLRNPEFARFFFIHEHFERFLTKVHGRYQPFWFFIPVLVGGMLPWSFFIPAGFRGVWRDRKNRGGEVRLYLALWAILIFLFFTKSSSKLPPYILPVFPAVSLLTGYSFSTLLEREFRPLRLPAWLLGLILGVAGAGAIVYPFVAPDPAISRLGGLIIGTLFICQGSAAIRAACRKDVAALILGLAAVSLVIMVSGPPFFLAEMAAFKSLKSLGLAVRRHVPPDAPLVSQGVLQGLSFYSHRRLIVFDGEGELLFGSRQGDQSGWFLKYNEFYALWDSDRPVYAVVRKDLLKVLPAFVRRPLRVVAENDKHALIVNR